MKAGYRRIARPTRGQLTGQPALTGAGLPAAAPGSRPGAAPGSRPGAGPGAGPAGGPGPRRAALAAITVAALPALVLTVASLPVTGQPARPLRGPARQYGAATQFGTCGRNPSGHRSPCTGPVPVADLPPATWRGGRVTALVSRPAALVDTRTWTTGGGNTFPGADVPFGMVQWSPDTLPHRNAGGGYSYGDTLLAGYSLTHLSGPGCSAAGDVPVLPLTGSLPGGDPSNVVTPFSNKGEVAQAGYYAARSNQPQTVTSQFTETPHSGMGRFTFPAGIPARFLVKLRDSQNGDLAASARIAGRSEISGSVTSGRFCGVHRYYRLYFDLAFSRPFRSARVLTRPGQRGPDAVLVSFPAASRVIEAKAAISYVGPAGARRNWRAEDPGWDFAAVRASAQSAWNRLLGRIQVAGGSAARTREFYSLLYKSFLEPSITSDVTGRFRGTDGKVHHLAPGQRDQYGFFSGWDIYHSLAQLQAMLAPSAASDMAQSLVNSYSENGILPQWGYLNTDDYVMVGDPADAVIADYYAFGARHFAVRQALADMIRQATTVNSVRPGQALRRRYGYLPENAHYHCCNPHGYVPSLLEYDTADFALSRFAAALGERGRAARLTARAGDWVHVFDHRNHLLTPRLTSGAFVHGITPATMAHYVEGSAQEYTWDVPNDYAGLIRLLGGSRAAARQLRAYLSRPAAGGRYAMLQNEFDLGEQNAPDYAGDPAGAQQAVNRIRTTLYRPGPSGLPGNDDLGAESSQFIWEMLGMYPENPGSDVLVFASPGFPLAVIHPALGRAITITAPGASPSRYYVRALRINGRPWQRLWVRNAQLTSGATLTWALSAAPTGWGAAPGDAPPSYRR